MDLTIQQPPLEETINAMSSVQLLRYNATTIESMKQSLARWEAELSAPEKPLTPYFI
jgi:NTE family protein